jgi:hypothetical protein
MDIFEKTRNGIVQHGPCPYCGEWNCSHDIEPANAERVVVQLKPYADDNRTEAERLTARFKARFGDT